MLTEKTWRPEAVIQFMGSLMASFCLGGAVIALLQKIGAAGFKSDDGLGTILVATLSFQGVAWGLAGIFLWQHRLDWREFFGLRDPRLGRAMGLAVVVVLVLLPAMWALQMASTWVLTHFGWKPEEETAVQLVENASSLGMQIYMTVFAVVLAPVAEEFIFRGVLFPFVRQLGLPKLAWLGVSGLFAVIHLDAATFLPLFVLALVLSWLYVRTNNLLAPITAHAVFNALNLAVIFAQPYLDKYVHLPAT